MNRREWIAVAAIVAFILFALLPTQTKTTWIDPVTGSLKRQSAWSGFKLAARFEPSDLERWLVRREGSHAPTWKFVSRSTHTMFGQSLGIACDTDVPIYLLRAGDPNTRFVAKSTDEQLAQFVRTMRTGTDEEKRDAIRTAYASVTED